jgi:hypothetical protein
MVKPQWHDRLRDELWKRGLPPGYSARLIQELKDHLTDMNKENLSMEAQMSAEEKLGSPELLALAAQKAFAGRTFAGRHPILTFVIGPIPIVAATSYAIVALCAMCESLVTPLEPVKSGPPTVFEWIVTYGCLSVSRFLPFVLTAWLFTRLGCRARRPAWGLAACGLVACFAFIWQFGIFPPTAQHNLGVFFRPEFGLWRWQDRVIQAIVPLALGVWTWRQMAYPPKNFPWHRHAEPSSAPTHA